MALVHPMMCCKSKGKFRFFFIQKWHRLQERNSKCRLGVNLLLSKLQENMIPPPSCVMVLTHKGRVAAPQNHGIAKIGKLHFTQIEEKNLFLVSWFPRIWESFSLLRKAVAKIRAKRPIFSEMWLQHSQEAEKYMELSFIFYIYATHKTLQECKTAPTSQF